MLLAFRLGVLPAEQAAPLKLLDKGVSKEALAGLVRARPACLHGRRVTRVFKFFCLGSECGI